MSAGRYQGPYPSAFSVDTAYNILVMKYDNSSSVIDVRSKDGFEVCCSMNNQSKCNPKDSKWAAASIVLHNDHSVRVSFKAQCVGMYIVGLRYAWRESPCGFKKCAIQLIKAFLSFDIVFQIQLIREFLSFDIVFQIQLIKAFLSFDIVFQIQPIKAFLSFDIVFQIQLIKEFLSFDIVFQIQLIREFLSFDIVFQIQLIKAFLSFDIVCQIQLIKEFLPFDIVFQIQ
ncbi:hypothetical protein CHS0354_017469 [Potamilus streckersoni]|uniref:Uncharacterized protein n=1 Tax=Potamilus streckersoni TaxID=2493646 RepID=A0AAE0TJD8_9BIVA|nr:hypothetical protein CHS0354_017469 [Potamilus streckersoni]